MSEIKPRSAADYGVSMTDRAAKRIASLSAHEGKPVLLRVAVAGGGCSGFQYGFELDDSRKDDDLVLERDGAVVVIDETSISLLQGSEIDWIEDLAGAMFVISNPNATSSCGCGTSFSVG